MQYEIELHLPALASCLHVVTACVGRLCRTTIGADDQEFQQAVHAACIHAIRHNYGGDSVDQRLELCFYASEGELLVELVDYGRPDAAVLSLATKSADTICQRLADEVRHERLEDGNRTTLMRRGKHARSGSNG